MDYCITKSDIAEDGYYIGAVSLAGQFDGTLSGEKDLGRVKFRHSLNITGGLNFPERSGLQVDGCLRVSGLLSIGCGIIALEDIFGGEGIWAGAGIQSLNGGIESRLSIWAGRSIIAGGKLSATGSVHAGENVFSGRGIKTGADLISGRGISANEEISCGKHLQAGRGITAGFWIDADTITTPLRIMAGLCRFRLPQPEETEVRFNVLEDGEVAFGRAVQKNLSA